MRWNYGDPELGTCKETIQGGNHFRYWAQNGNGGNRCVQVDSITLRFIEIQLSIVVLYSWRHLLRSLLQVRDTILFYCHHLTSQADFRDQWVTTLL